MKAAQINGYGERGAVKINDAPKPVAGDGQVVVEVYAAGLDRKSVV